MKTLKAIDSGVITEIKISKDQLLVTIVDSLGDGHVHNLNYSGFTQPAAFEIVTKKQKELNAKFQARR